MEASRCGMPGLPTAGVSPRTGRRKGGPTGTPLHSPSLFLPGRIHVVALHKTSHEDADGS